jgi:hypothetical protein
LNDIATIAERSAAGQSTALVLSRRHWLALAASAPLLSRRVCAGTDEEGLEEIKARAKAVGMGPFRVTRSDHYVAIGDAPDRYRKDALDVCEAVARDCLDHFKARGFSVAWPEKKLVVVVLAGDESYARFLGVEREAAVGGEFDRDTNRLTTFDFRKANGPPNPRAARANTVSLVHEATHQWTFNSGLLDRKADVPVAISEGLAMYAEERPPTGKANPGGINKGRVDGLRVGLQKRVAWTPLEHLLTDDDLAGGAGDEATQQMAYAQDWLLVFQLMQRGLSRSFQGYLDRIRTRHDAGKRLDDARETLGDLTRLDRNLRDRARRLVEA